HAFKKKDFALELKMRDRLCTMDEHRLRSRRGHTIYQIGLAQSNLARTVRVAQRRVALEGPCFGHISCAGSCGDLEVPNQEITDGKVAPISNGPRSVGILQHLCEQEA